MSTSTKLTKPQEDFLRQAQKQQKGAGAVTGYRPAARLLELGFIAAVNTKNANYAYYKPTVGGEQWLKDNDP